MQIESLKVLHSLNSHGSLRLVIVRLMIRISVDRNYKNWESRVGSIGSDILAQNIRVIWMIWKDQGKVHFPVEDSLGKSNLLFNVYYPKGLLGNHMKTK